MAIAFDAAANSSVGATSWSHTCSGSDRILFVSVTTLSAIVPTATYNGVAMTLIGTVSTGVNYRATLLYLVAPATGSNTVIISSGQGASASYTGAHQLGIPSATNTGANSTSTLSVATTTTIDLSWVVMAGTSERSVNATQSAGTSTTLRAATPTTDSRIAGIYDNNAAKTPAGSVCLEFTHSGTGGSPATAAVTCAFAPVQEPLIFIQQDTNTTTDSITGTYNIIAITPTDTNVTTDIGTGKYKFSNGDKSASPTWITTQKS